MPSTSGLPFEIPPERRAFIDRILEVGERKYHDKHSFHAAMNRGALSRDDLRVWAINRFHYQRTIPKKDAAILMHMEDPAIRRRWIVRVLEHDGRTEGEGGIDAWLALVEAVGGTRADALSGDRVLPGVRFAVDAYLDFCRRRPWIESVASSLTELFAQRLHRLRLDAFIEHYPWVDEPGLRYFRSRIALLHEDVSHGLELVLEYCKTLELEDKAVAALEFKCDLLWAQLDAIEAACSGRDGDSLD